MIEDRIMMVFSFFFVGALIPQVWAGFGRRPGVRPFTSGVTALALIVYVGCGLRLGLKFAPVAWGITAVLWLVIFAQEFTWRKIEAIRRGG